jgi:hypothetical protein
MSAALALVVKLRRYGGKRSSDPANVYDLPPAGR